MSVSRRKMQKMIDICNEYMVYSMVFVLMPRKINGFFAGKHDKCTGASFKLGDKDIDHEWDS